MNKILEIKFGSHLYGTNTPESDLDLKGIYLPTARQIVLGKYPQTIAKGRNKLECERNTKDDVDHEYFSLDRYLELLAEGQTVALDVLFAPESSYTENTTAEGIALMRLIRANRDKLITKNVNAFVGYARQQAAKYGIKGSRMDALKRTHEWLGKLSMLRSPYEKLSRYDGEIDCLVAESAEMVSLEKTPLIEVVMLKGPNGLMDAPHLRINGRAIPFHANLKYAREVVGKMLESYGGRAKKAHLAGGIDWKALSHAVRVNGEALELLQTDSITFPRPDREKLLQVKLGQLPYEQVAEMIEQGLADLHIVAQASTMREEPDLEWVDDFVYKVYSKIVRNT
jgi:hypothetical protein